MVQLLVGVCEMRLRDMVDEIWRYSDTPRQSSLAEAFGVTKRYFLFYWGDFFRF